MNAKQILIVSNSNEKEMGLSIWKRLGKSFETEIVNTDERAIEMANRQHFDMVVIDGTCAEINSEKLSAILPILQTEIEVLRYEGETVLEFEKKVKSCFYKKKTQKIVRFLILAESAPKAWKNMPSFSAN